MGYLGWLKVHEQVEHEHIGMQTQNHSMRSKIDM